MPELPEVETVRRMLEPHVREQTITAVTLREFAGVLETTLPGEPRSWLRGRTITAAQRRGKYLLFPLDDGHTMVVHLRMTGRLLVVAQDAAPVRFEHLRLHLGSHEELRFADQRKFGRVSIFNAEEIARLDARLGPEPLDPATSATMMHARLARHTASIKAMLLDQTVIAGLGNIYVDEVLWATCIHPLTPANTLSVSLIDGLLDAARKILASALANQGTTFSSFENPYGETGNNAAFLKVYGRTKSGGMCERCGTPLVRTVVAGRGTTFCPQCQVMPASGHPT